MKKCEECRSILLRLEQNIYNIILERQASHQLLHKTRLNLEQVVVKIIRESSGK